MHFAIASIPATKVSDDGQTVTLRAQDAQGGQLDIEARYTVLEELANALNEASAGAHRVRRMLTTVDESASIGEIEPMTLKTYRFSVADDKSALLLQLKTSIDRTDILLPRDAADGMAGADEFVKDAQNALELLRAPQGLN